MAKSVREAMTSNPRCVTPETAVAEVARVMRTEDVGSLPIVTDADRVVGMVTDRDLVLRVLAKDLDPHKTVVADACTEDPEVATASESLDAALQRMAQKQVRRLPVVDDGGRLVGILAQADVARTSQASETGRMVEEISEASPGAR